MTAETMETFRICLLQILRTVTPHAVPVARLVAGAKLKGFAEADATLVQSELSYLGDKGFVIEEEKALSPENAWWRITASGRDFLAKHGM